ncbi:unnamed protein product [Laminaria digitata]
MGVRLRRVYTSGGRQCQQTYQPQNRDTRTFRANPPSHDQA